MCRSKLIEFLAELSDSGAELSESSFSKQHFQNSTPPVSKPIHAGKMIGELSMREYMRGLYLHSREHRKMYIEELLSEYFAKFLRELISVRMHAASAFTPRRIQEENPGELFMYWFSLPGVFHPFS